MQTMTISIEKDGLLNETHTTYGVITFFGDVIHTTVTHDPDTVSHWIFDIQFIHRSRLDNLVVGLDIEWRRPAVTRLGYINPVATLQLCVGRRCLVFQLIHSSHIPIPLLQFFSKPNYTFAGVEIRFALAKLERDYGFGCNAKIMELGPVAGQVYKCGELQNAGLRNLASFVLNKNVWKPRRVIMSRWDNRWLTNDQVLSACVDAYTFFEMGRFLRACRNRN